MAYTFFELTSEAVVLRQGDDGEVDELEARGWRSAPRYEGRLGEADEKDAERLARRSRQRLNRTPLDAPAAGARVQGWVRARRWALPPLEFGAPRHINDEGQQDDGERAYSEELPHALAGDVLEELVDQARDGYERQGKRVEGIERRAGLYQGGATISGGLVITGTGLVAGKDAVFTGALRPIALVGLACVAALLGLSGWRAHQASVFTFTWARPNVRGKVRARAHLLKLDPIRRDLLCALLLGQDRGQVIAQWKLARLKQAARLFIWAVAASAVVSGLLIFSLLRDL